MKRMAYAVMSIGLVFAFAACKWEVPEKVSVTSNADYNFSLGNFEKQLEEDLDLQSMMGSTGEGNNDINTYDYFPGKADKNVQRFLLEIKVHDEQLIAPQPDTAMVLDYTDDTNPHNPASIHETKELEFNPASFFKGLEDALGSEMAGKIIFSEVPMYFYYDIGNEVSANAKFDMFYASKDGSLTECTGTRKTILEETINNNPKPVYEKENEVVISDLNKKPYSAKADITNMINKCDDNGTAFTSVTDDDQLCVEYTISSFKGTIDATNGVNLAIYAVIELPLSFKVIDNDLNLDLHKMTGEDAAESSGEPAGSGDDEFTKYLQVIDSVSIRYISYQLPFYSKSGIKLGIDLIGDGKDIQYAPIKIVDKNKPKADSDKSVISLYQKTIIRMKDLATFNPNIQLQMLKGTVFSVPRNKGVDMSVELNLITDGTVEIN